MKSKSTGISLSKLAAVAMVAMSCVSAFATNGYFSHGYGMKAKGMGGASVAMTDNAFGGANNPAIAAWAGDRVEVGVDVFMPERSQERTGLGVTKSDSNSFLVPEFGYNRKINDQMGWGVTVYGNGGMNTDYPAGVIPAGGCGPGSPASNLFCGPGKIGVDLQQLIVAPTQSFGVSPLLVQQIFKADGLKYFSDTNQSASPNNLTNNGYDSSNGFGLRVGYLGKFGDMVSIGASYSPRVSMSKLSKYSGLFAEEGGFDIPESYTLGFTASLTPEVTLAMDYQRIGYGSVRSVANPSAGFGGALGNSTGPGFGWKDVNVTKIGVQWAFSPALTLRAGVNIGDNPISSADASFNTLAPGVVTTHYTLGATYAISKSMDLTASYMMAPSNSVSGPQGQPGVTDTIKMNQQSIGLQLGWHW
jgi:long-chain fatty acid transport protein